MSSTPWRPQPAMGLRRDATARRLPPQSLRAVPVAEWHILLTERPNVLIEGDESDIEATMVALAPHLQAEISDWCRGIPLNLPRHRSGTIILGELSVLRPEEQWLLLEWLQASGSRTQVISRASTPLFQMVERGAFLEDLYYRLNTVRLDLNRT